MELSARHAQAALRSLGFSVEPIETSSEQRADFSVTWGAEQYIVEAKLREASPTWRDVRVELRRPDHPSPLARCGWLKGLLPTVAALDTFARRARDLAVVSFRSIPDAQKVLVAEDATFAGTRSSPVITLPAS